MCILLLALSPALSDPVNILNLCKFDSRDWINEPINVYIGRGSPFFLASIWGNPFMLKDYSRDEAVCLFENHLFANRELLESVKELKGKKLWCYCAPLRCHGEILHNAAGNIPVYQK